MVPMGDKFRYVKTLIARPLVFRLQEAVEFDQFYLVVTRIGVEARFLSYNPMKK